MYFTTRYEFTLRQQEVPMARTVADLLVGVLEQVGVKHIFGLIGDSLNPLGHAVRRSDIATMLWRRSKKHCLQ
jgi:glyoxylate carboligase